MTSCNPHWLRHFGYRFPCVLPRNWCAFEATCMQTIGEYHPAKMPDLGPTLPLIFVAMARVNGDDSRWIKGYCSLNFVVQQHIMMTLFYLILYALRSTGATLSEKPSRANFDAEYIPRKGLPVEVRSQVCFLVWFHLFILMWEVRWTKKILKITSYMSVSIMH